jgi:hypothetical protein
MLFKGMDRAIAAAASGAPPRVLDIGANHGLFAIFAALRGARVAAVEACVEIKIVRRVRAESSRRPPRHRRDACSMAWRCRFLAARPSQDGRVVAEK